MLVERAIAVRPACSLKCLARLRTCSLAFFETSLARREIVPSLSKRFLEAFDLRLERTDLLVACPNSFLHLAHPLNGRSLGHSHGVLSAIRRSLGSGFGPCAVFLRCAKLGAQFGDAALRVLGCGAQL